MFETGEKVLLQCILFKTNRVENFRDIRPGKSACHENITSWS